MLSCSRNWKSVRKVRYYDDIEFAINYVLANKFKKFKENDFLNKLSILRQKRNNLIQKHYQYSIRTKRSLYITKFRTTLTDTLIFLKEIKVFKIDDGIIVPLELSIEYLNYNNIYDKKAIILNYILISKYKAYICFLKHLYSLKEFRIKAQHQKRDKITRDYLSETGFNTDVVSFYTIRDLFYELGVLNWYINDDRTLVIYPTIEMNKHYYNHKNLIKYDGDNIYLFKEINYDEFIKELEEEYLKMTNRRYRVNLNLMDLRDAVCKKYGLSDFYFSDIIFSLQNIKKTPIKISINFGYTTLRKRNYNLKLLSLPKVSSNRLGLYIKLDKVMTYD